jgi:hypothetical protein
MTITIIKNIMPAMNEVSPTAGQIEIFIKIVIPAATRMTCKTSTQRLYKAMSRTRGKISKV